MHLIGTSVGKDLGTTGSVNNPKLEFSFKPSSFKDTTEISTVRVVMKMPLSNHRLVVTIYAHAAVDIYIYIYIYIYVCVCVYVCV